MGTSLKVSPPQGRPDPPTVLIGMVARWLMLLMGENAGGRTTFGLLSSPDGRSWQPLPEHP